MAEDRWVELPEHVVAKIEKVLGIPPSELAQYGIAKLVEELCDTALMFDLEESGARRTQQNEPADEAPPPPPPSPENDH